MKRDLSLKKSASIKINSSTGVSLFVSNEQGCDWSVVGLGVDGVGVWQLETMSTPPPITGGDMIKCLYKYLQDLADSVKEHGIANGVKFNEVEQ